MNSNMNVTGDHDDRLHDEQQSLMKSCLDQLLARIDSVLNKLIPADCGGAQERRRRKMFLISHIFGPLLGLQVPLAMWFTDPAPYPHVHILAASIAGFWLFLPLMPLLPRHYGTLATLSITNLSFAVLWASYHYGGVSSPFMLWYMLVPLLGFFYFGGSWRARVEIVVHILLGLGIFSVAFLLGDGFPTHLPVTNMVKASLFSLLCSTLYIYFMAAYYTWLFDSRSDLLEEVRLHKKTSADLTSAKQLLEMRNRELEASKIRLEHTALHDALTGLPNRRYLDAELARMAQKCAADNGTVVLLHIDLDRFKLVNDKFGHAAGDMMLVHIARLLCDAVSEGDFVSRVGGDEFVVIYRMPANANDPVGMANSIIEKICRPMPYLTYQCRVGACIGIAMETSANFQPDRLMLNADLALYRAKESGRNRAELFSDGLQAQATRTNQIADDLLSGIENGEFVVYYQPQIDAQTFEVVGVEALVRWEHPTEGLLAPPAFLGIAEEMNLVAEIDRRVLQQAIADLAVWQKAGVALDRISVNVSAKRLGEEGLVASLRKLNIAPGSVAFELVESIFFDEADLIAERNIAEIRRLGIEIEIDDFGTGRASIVSLLRLRPDRLKIDKQFIQPLLQSPEQSRLVASLIEIGKSLGIEIVAEGVETMEQAMLLKKIGCDVFQGYAFARPMPADELGRYILERGEQSRKCMRIA